MKNGNLLLELYTDYLIYSAGLVTAISLAEVVDNDVIHDKISRFLLNYKCNAQTLWYKVKLLVRNLENTDAGYLTINDTVEEKPYTDTSEFINFHYSHAKHKHVKGINILTSMVRYGEVALPVDYHLITKLTEYIDKNNNIQCKSDLNRNKISTTFIDDNYIFCSILAFIKLGTLKLKASLNHFALRNKSFINAIKAALNQLQKYKIAQDSIQMSIA